MSLTNTPAPAPQDFVVTELRGIIEVCGDSPTAIVSVERMRLWLSKLRAPVATTTDRAMLQSVLQDLENSDSVCPRCGHSDRCADMDVAYMIRDHLKGEASAPVADERAAPIKRYYRGTEQMQEVPSGDWVRYDDHVAALASAPVAGEAPPRPDDREIETIVQGLGMRWDGSRWVLEDADLHPLVRALLYRYTAAPQASEAVRTALHDLVDVLQKRHFGRMPDEVQRAFDAARAALSAQPGAQKKESRVGTNTGHGHVWRRPDGYLARCGGPAICRECARDQAQAHPDNKDGGAVYG